MNKFTKKIIALCYAPDDAAAFNRAAVTFLTHSFHMIEATPEKADEFLNSPAAEGLANIAARFSYPPEECAENREWLESTILEGMEEAHASGDFPESLEKEIRAL